MKRINSIGKLILVGIFAVLFTPSCTNLDEELYDVVTPEDFLKGEEQYVAYLGQAYTRLYGYANNSYHEMSEVTTDEIVVPTRGADWDDGGTHRRRELHTWSYEDNGGAWGDSYSGISDCNRLIESFQILADDGGIEQEVADGYIAELSALRAFWYYLLVDTYGNVPIVTEFSTADKTPPTKSRTEVYNFIINELQTWTPKLPKDNGGAVYGRMNYWAAKALETKVRMNAKVYSGTADYDGVIAAADEIINSGKFSLETDYFANFNLDSENSSEFIFAIPFDKIFAKGFNMNMRSLHYGMVNTYNFTAQPWNGWCTIEEFYNSFDDKDLRKGDRGTVTGPAQKRGTFIAGYQYFADGVKKIEDPGFEVGKDLDGAPLNLDPVVNSLGPNALKQAGARIGKWEYEVGGTDNMSNDYGVFRYSDILLMKAEAIWRKTNSATDATALALVNQVRITHGGSAIAPLTTLDGPISYKIEEGVQPGGELLNERGRELAFENFRRQDLLRWGIFHEVSKYTPPNGFPGEIPNTDPTRNIFPIPRAQLESNPNLVQNPGYTGG